MNLHHTTDEIRYWDKQKELAYDLSKLYTKTKSDRVNMLAQEIGDEVNVELAKYHYLIDRRCILKKNSMYNQNTIRSGTIKEITHFNAFSNSVRVRFQYDNGGFDGVSLLDLELNDE